MKKHSLFILVLFITTISNGWSQIIVDQDTLYGNEWINYDQDYFKIKVAKDGIYRITFEELREAGVFNNANAPDVSQFQLFYMGQEIPIYVSSTDNFSVGDYMEFYGQKNRGWLDQFLYIEPEYQPNPAYSLFSDTSAYFLTWKADANPRRFQNINSDIQNNGQDKEAYCFVKIINEFHDRYSNGRAFQGSSGYISRYDIGEGYVRSTSSPNQSYNINTPNYFAAGPKPMINSHLFALQGSHKIEFSINNITQPADSFINWASKLYSFEAENWSDKNKITIKGTHSENDKFHVGAITVEYPSTFDFQNQPYFEFELEASSTEQYIEIENFQHNGSIPTLYDLTNNLRIEIVKENDLLKAVLPASSQRRHCVLVSKDNLQPVSAIEKQSFEVFNFENEAYDYLILSHPALFDDGNGVDYVRQYADYRNSPQGGNYNSIIVDVNQLYDQFGYGIDYHELAMRNFLKVAAKKWKTTHLFILGKGVNKEIRRNQSRYYSEEYNWPAWDLVPPFGKPHSDYLFVMDKNSSVPTMAVGRIAAYTPNQVKTYLTKVKDFEYAQKNTPYSLEDRAWMKRVLHFGGGDPAIQNIIKRELNAVKTTAEEGAFGANVVSFFKNSTDVIQALDFDEVSRYINEGSALMTFFGHSAATTLDFSLGAPTEYSNYKKYPMFYAMGCNTNRVFNTRATLSEDWVFAENGGAVAFLGTTELTELNNLSNYGREFYQNFATQEYGKTIGEIIQANIRDFYPNSQSFIPELMKHIMMLHGDPALKLYPYETPDVVINKKKTQIKPDLINVLADSFKLNLTVNNIGRIIEDSINIAIEQIRPDGKKVAVYQLRTPTPKFEENFTINLPITDRTGLVGKNQLNITIDANNEIVETPAQAEQNNKESITFFVTSQDVRPIYPIEFGIVNTSDLRLKAATSNPFSPSIKYYFEIDTTANFDSPLRKTQAIEQRGGLVEWSPKISLKENTVYYWRTSIDSTLTNGRGFIWNTSSFTYLPSSSEGWSQGHFHQLLSTTLQTAVWDSLSRRTQFGDLYRDIEIRGATYEILGWIEVAIFEDGFRKNSGYACPSPNNYTEQVILVTYDPFSLKRSTVLPPLGATPNCKNKEINWAIYHLHSPEERAKLIQKLQDIPSNEVVALFTTQRSDEFGYYADEWAADSTLYGTNIFQLLEEQGAQKVRSLEQQQLPYIYIYQKDNPDFEQVELKADSSTQIIIGEKRLKGVDRKGNISSPIIGPAKSWGTLEWGLEDVELVDEAQLNVLGVKANGIVDTLFKNVTANSAELNAINANEYHYLRLQYDAVDTINHTMPQLKYWRVLYESLPDALLNSNEALTFHADTLQQGEPLRLELAISNPTNKNMDSLLMKYTIITNENKEIVSYRRDQPLVADGTFVASYEFDTKDLSGRNQLIIEANPNQDQPELYDFNNLGIQDFFVASDQRNPLLDVTFDGVRIMNGDIVSPKPTISVFLKDENQFLALSDTSVMEVSILSPSGELEKMEANDPRLTFYPADEKSLESKNEARIELRPEFGENGKYQLQVKAKDVTGNSSGAYKYTVDFEVINELQISNVFNYPNPFTTSTQFVFTLTGEQLPEDMRIQIMTVSGSVIRDIEMHELGNLKIGLNRTSFKWDGTDEYGDQLANGVYLYRVLIKGQNEEEYEKFETDTDQYFQGGIGKMVLIR